MAKQNRLLDTKTVRLNKSGLKVRYAELGDSLNGESVDDLNALKSAVSRLKAGAPTVLQIERKGRMQYSAFELQ